MLYDERLRAALAAYEAEVQHRPVPPPMPATDHMSDGEAAEFWFKEWEYMRDEWNRGWIAARVLADEVRAVLAVGVAVDPFHLPASDPDSCEPSR